MYIITVMVYFCRKQRPPSLYPGERDYHLDSLFSDILNPDASSPDSHVDCQVDAELVRNYPHGSMPDVRTNDSSTIGLSQPTSAYMPFPNGDSQPNLAYMPFTNKFRYIPAQTDESSPDSR